MTFWEEYRENWRVFRQMFTQGTETFATVCFVLTVVAAIFAFCVTGAWITHLFLK